MRLKDEPHCHAQARELGTATAGQARHRAVQISRAVNQAGTWETKAALEKAGVTSRKEMSDPEKLIGLSKHLRTNGVRDVTGWLLADKLGSVAVSESAAAGIKVADVLESRLARYRAGRGALATGRNTMGESW